MVPFPEGPAVPEPVPPHPEWMFMAYSKKPQELWENSFQEQIAQQAYNTAPVEALVRTAAYHLRAIRPDGNYSGLHFLEMGCGTGPNLKWLAQKGITVSGIDISRNALALARKQLEDSGLGARIAEMVEGSVAKTPFPDASFDGIFEALVFQHLSREDRLKAFAEVRRVLKPGGVFIGNMLDAGHTIFLQRQGEQLKDDPGTLILKDGGSNIHLNNLGLCHFSRREEFDTLLAGFSVVDPSVMTYYLPKFEARKRGYEEYLQSMWTVYAVK
jgi:ubiquinone/menaquinone biosynthesis C-methylase UbiE